MSMKRSSGTVPGFGSGDPDNWMSALFRRPSDETVHVDDEEFNDTISGTAVTPSGTATWVQDRGVLSVKFQDQTPAHVAVRLYPLTPTTAPVTIETALRVYSASDAGYTMAGIIITDGNTDTADAITIWFAPGAIASGPKLGSKSGVALTSMSTNPITAYTFSQAHGPMPVVYLRLIWTAANTFEYAISIDGVTWSDMAVGSGSKTITPAYFGAFVSTDDNASNDCFATFEYLRVTESDLSV